MSVISGPGAGRAPLPANEGVPEQGPVIIQAAPSQSGDQLQVLSSTGTLLAHQDINGNWRGQAFTGLGVPFNEGFSAVTMTADANQTLTAAQAQNGILSVVGGATLTATRNIVIPVIAGASYTVFNGTTGVQALQFIGATGTGITVANGKRAILYCDGTNWVRVTADT